MREEKLPKGWKVLKFKDVTTIIGGGTPSTSIEEYYDGDIPWLSPVDLSGYQEKYISRGRKNITRLGLQKSSARLLPKNSILFSSRAPIGYVAIASNEIATNQGFKNLLPSPLYDPSFAYYYLKYKKDYIESQASGTTFKEISGKKLGEIEFLLPPLSEQKRIVAKLDLAFGHLDRVREKLDRIPELLKNFRQQVLIKAMTGELTGELELADNFILESSITIGNEIKIKPQKWNWRLLTELARLESGHTPRKSREDYWEKGNVPWISLQDIRSAHGKVINETRYMPNQKGIENSSARLLPAGTVCFSRDISVGYVTIMGKEMATSQHFANWICGENLNNKFLLYAFMASRDYLVGEGKGTTVGTIYMPALKQMRLLIPPLDIQMKIVNKLDKFFLLADKIESQYQNLKAKIDQMPQAILAKAFRGELVGQEVKEYVREIGELGMVAEGVGSTNYRSIIK